MKIIKPSELENRKPPADFVQRVENSVNTWLEKHYDISRVSAFVVPEKDAELWEFWRTWLTSEFLKSDWQITIKKRSIDINNLGATREELVVEFRRHASATDYYNK